MISISNSSCITRTACLMADEWDEGEMKMEGCARMEDNDDDFKEEGMMEDIFDDADERDDDESGSDEDNCGEQYDSSASDDDVEEEGLMEDVFDDDDESGDGDESGSDEDWENAESGIDGILSSHDERDDHESDEKINRFTNERDCEGRSSGRSGRQDDRMARLTNDNADHKNEYVYNCKSFCMSNYCLMG